MRNSNAHMINVRIIVTAIDLLLVVLRTVVRHS
jgi:hypothetical protein